MSVNNIETKVENLLKDVIQNLGYELYDVIYAKEAKDFYLRIIIDKKDGIDLNDCEKVNDAINDILDEADYIKDQYFLEVSSPGVERVLRKPKHFQSQVGNEILVKLFKPLEKQKEFTGILKSYSEEELILTQDDKEIKIEVKNIALARTVFDW
ncbi:MAG: ribosome maturation factor RimP [Clostridia bacterium]|nr:ribosome maturation factor RimP [Clostridia bacterium]